ncbi:MAG: NADH-quinone oxidoreductase subunit J [Prevotella sp.]|nr:NADH-quinone oxidoreductase subunit J [Prevotella sp.]
MANIIMFAILAAVIICSAIFSVMTKSIMRAVTALLFVLFAIAGLYFLLDYTFLGTAQLSIYAGGMTMIYIFAIQLISKRRLQGLKEKIDFKRMTVAALVALVGFVTVVVAQLKSEFFEKFCSVDDVEVPMEKIGNTLMGADKYQYVLPFEFISLFLLACIIGGLVVSRNQKEDK